MRKVLSVMPNQNPKTLLFVYNAEHGVFNLLTDIAKKSFNMEGTCSLCDLTHDPLKMKNEWKAFIDSLPYQSVFTYKDTFQKEHPALMDTPLPAIFVKEAGAMTLLIEAHEINTAADLSALKKLVRARLEIHP